MQYINRILAVAALAFLAHTAFAQPPARKSNDQKEKKSPAATVGLSPRAMSQFPTNATPQEVDWKREVYRSLELQKEKNASLYYPVEPTGGTYNLFTYIFLNILEGNITAYKYNLDGLEQFTEENVLSPMDMLENYRIYYEEKDGKVVVGNSDIPSAEVMSYYIKESYWYDQRTGTYGQMVTAICPVLHRSGDFGSEVTKYPMFWLKYDEISPLLAQQPMMTSSLNNVMSMTMDDFFRRGCYEGEIYKTVNTRNLAIAQYCTDSASVKKEQEKIEQQLKDFRTNLWNTKTVAQMRQDSIDAATAAANDTIAAKETAKKAPKKERVARSAGTKRAVAAKKTETKKTKTTKSRKEKSPGNTGGDAKVSVRRTRR